MKYIIKNLLFTDFCHTVKISKGEITMQTSYQPLWDLLQIEGMKRRFNGNSRYVS